MLGSKPINTPMDPNVKLTAVDGEILDDPKTYRRLVGGLNYLTVTRQDIAFSVSLVSQFLATPRITHWNVVIRILRYLKGALGRGGFSDPDWAGSPIDRRPTTGYYVFLGGNLVSWKSKKQPLVPRSSAKSEYRAMAHATWELMWIRQLLTELGFDYPSSIQLCCDYQAAIHIVSNPVFHERTKHIEVDCNFVREKIQQGLVSTCHVKTGEQLADIFTNSLRNERIQYLCNKLGMIDIYAPT
ncbi:hypothetical protein CFOL_v3_17283 [Cephalotus follicularis]|uniref:RVT_2 domain-containing protein n=1 Tax=Cephalotus follicularis TaxID=3775 RepID=A0A1Q3C0M0_CEPFO|nr:hypothetical protein CFOL_v3_17283 [Cephalotus follicularis]